MIWFRSTEPVTRPGLGATVSEHFSTLQPTFLQSYSADAGPVGDYISCFMDGKQHVSAFQKMCCVCMKWFRSTEPVPRQGFGAMVSEHLGKPQGIILQSNGANVRLVGGYFTCLLYGIEHGSVFQEMCYACMRWFRSTEPVTVEALE